MERPISTTLGSLLDEITAIQPNNPALLFNGQCYTFAEFQYQVNLFARGLLQIGVRKGTHVAILMSNRPEWLFVDFACAKIGATLIGINTWFHQDELEFVLHHSDTEFLVTMDRFAGNDFSDTLSQICPELVSKRAGPLQSTRLPLMKHVICLGPNRLAGMLPFEDIPELGSELVSMNMLKETASEVHPNDIANILYTSGTTAFPKGIMLRHGDMIANGFDIGERQHLKMNDRLWLGVPLFFSLASANAVIAVLTHGGSFAIQERFEAEEAMNIIEHNQCTVFYGMPNMVQAIESHDNRPRYDLGSLRTGVTIGPPESIRRTANLGVSEICNVYGMTETYGNCTVTDASEPLDIRMNAQGKPLPGMDVRVINVDTHEKAEADEIGEIRVNGYITPGYYNDNDLTRESLDESGYLRTGDLGYLDKEGRLHYIGRSKDMIKTGGINVSPLEIEMFLMRNEKVRQAHVVGIPDEVKGEVIAALIELHDTNNESVDHIRHYCKGAIASYKIPTHLLFINEVDLPRTATGKVQRKLLGQLVNKLLECEIT